MQDPETGEGEENSVGSAAEPGNHQLMLLFATAVHSHVNSPKTMKLIVQIQGMASVSWWIRAVWLASLISIDLQG